MKFPPHLPNRSKLFARSRNTVSLSAFFILVSVIFLTAMAGTLVTIAWIAPDPQSSVITRTIREVQAPSRNEVRMQPLVEQQVRQRRFVLFDARKKRGEFYPANAVVGQSVIVNAQGWSAMYYPTYQRGMERNWELRTFLGDLIEIESVVFDPSHGIVYINAQGNEHRGDVQFFGWNDDVQSGHVFAAVGVDEMRAVALDVLEQIREETPHNLSLRRYAYTVKGEYLPGDMVLSQEGMFAGFIDNQGMVLPSWTVQQQLQSLFEEGTLTTGAIDPVGQFVRLDNHFGADVSYGFYIEQLSPAVARAGFERGDVIVAVDGVSLTEESAAQIMQTGRLVEQFQILRDEEVRLIEVSQ